MRVDCGGLFADWLRAGHETQQDGEGEALADTAKDADSLLHKPRRIENPEYVS
jgi:hypothetical protein